MGSPDVVIIGGGSVGCAVARALARGGARVEVLERAIPGAEASSAAAGIIGAQGEADSPGPFLDLCLRSRSLYADWTAALEDETGVSVGWRRSGLLHLAHDEVEGRLLTRRVEQQAALGLHAEVLDRAQVLALEPAVDPSVLGAVWFPEDGQVDPRRLVKALAIGAERAGAHFRTGAVARRVVHEGGRVLGVDVDGVLLPAGTVVLAAGAWSSLVPGAGLPERVVRPARGQLLKLETRSPVLSAVVYSAAGYVVPRADGTVLVGSTLEMVGFHKAVTVSGLAALAAIATGIAPSLGAASVVDSWAGFRPHTGDLLPLLGPTPLHGLLLATGHYRNGILLTPVTAEIIAALVLRGESPVDLGPFSMQRLEDPGADT
ncbi:MAG: glycine oxidase ThiO [Myxococcales bacterium]